MCIVKASSKTCLCLKQISYAIKLLTVNNSEYGYNMTCKICEADLVIYVHGYKCHQEKELQLEIS